MAIGHPCAHVIEVGNPPVEDVPGPHRIETAIFTRAGDRKSADVVVGQYAAL